MKRRPDIRTFSINSARTRHGTGLTSFFRGLGRIIRPLIQSALSGTAKPFVKKQLKTYGTKLLDEGASALTSYALSKALPKHKQKRGGGVVDSSSHDVSARLNELSRIDAPNPDKTYKHNEASILGMPSKSNSLEEPLAPSVLSTTNVISRTRKKKSHRQKTIGKKKSKHRKKRTIKKITSSLD